MHPAAAFAETLVSDDRVIGGESRPWSAHFPEVAHIIRVAVTDGQVKTKGPPIRPHGAD